MLLLIDAGNTLVKWATVTQEAGRNTPWSDHGAVAHADIPSLRERWQSGDGIRPIKRALISNVAGGDIRNRLERLLDGLNPGSVEWFSSKPALAGIRNGYVDFTQLGCDRFAAMVGARSLFPDQALIVATCGTATTIDAVTPEGAFIGGMILPGLKLMAAALARNTAQLPQISRSNLDSSLFADNTDSAIAAGCITAQAGAIEHAVAEHEKTSGSVQCVLSGGAAPYISPHLSTPHRIVDNLVLIGLHTSATG